MKNNISVSRSFFVLIIASVFLAGAAWAQSAPTVLNKEQAKTLVPTSFYFKGQSAQTQVRNSSVASFGKDRHVIVGLVDTSGYSADVASQYEGFFIVDFPVKVGGVRLATGSYGFGFTKDGSVRLQDIGGRALATVKTENDSTLKRPRPLMLMVVNGELRFYKGRSYAVVSAN